MKRMWIGGGLLALMLLVGLLVGEGLEGKMTPVAAAMEQAGISARAGDWERAEVLTHEAETCWEEMKWLTAALTGHEELEQIDDAFTQLPAYAGVDAPTYQAISDTIAGNIKALTQNHATTWKNFF